MSASPGTASQIEILLKRWRASLELHLRYAKLDEQRYWHVQPWPPHVRPVPLILNLAQQKLTALERIVARRVAEDDRTFVEALELMALLSNLVGLQNIERYIPLADPATERRDVLTAPNSVAVAPAAKQSPRTETLPREDMTRQMSTLHPGKLGQMLLAQKAGVPYKARTSRSHNGHKHASSKTATPSKAVAPKPAPRSLEALVVDDVIRLVNWGRATHELPDLIASMNGRPTATAVRKIIKDYRVHIARQLGPR